jgi:hypothetical protein
MFEPVEIPLTKGYVALVDPIDADLVDSLWHPAKTSKAITVYVQRMIKVEGRSTTEYMHRVILSRILGRPLKRNEQADHIDLNGMNNCRSNLRLATNGQNQRNQRRPPNNTSGYKGVSYNKRRGQWEVQLCVNYHHTNVGYFDTPEEAYAAYCEAAKQYHGEFARLE